MLTPNQHRKVERQWEQIDSKLASGEIDAPYAIDALDELGLLRRDGAYDLYENGEKQGILWVLHPSPLVIPGARLIFDLNDRDFGPLRIYRPLRDLMVPGTSK